MITLGEFIRELLSYYNQDEAKWVVDIGFNNDGDYVIFLKDVNDKESEIVIPAHNR